MVTIDSNPPDFPEFEQEQQSEHYEKIAKIHRLEPAWSLGKLLEADLREEFIIDQVMIENQSKVVAGEFKTLKTTILIMLALCLCSGAKFLNRFEVFKKKRVLFCSAESGKRKIRNTIYAVAKQMGISVADLRDSGFLQLSWWVPKIRSQEVMEYFKNEIDKAKAEVVIIDPLYQALDDQQASMILNGQQLAELCNYILDAGATPVCCDHVKRSSENARNREPLELSDISGAGKAEYFRQWMLVSRRSKFAPEENRKPHELWLSIGGSEGHSSQWSLDVVESFDDSGKMDIKITTTPRHEVIEEINSKKKSRSEENRVKKEAEKAKAFDGKVDTARKYFARSEDPLQTKTDIRDALTCNSELAGAILFRLVDDGDIVKHPEFVKRGRQNCEAWHSVSRDVPITDSKSDKPDKPDKKSTVPLVPIENRQTKKKLKRDRD